MFPLTYYAVAFAMVAIPAALIFLAAKFAHRVCAAHRWTQRLACGFTLTYLCLLAAPFVLSGSEGAMLWTILVLPFFIPFEYLAALGFIPFALITSVVTASFWGMLLYVLFAIALLIRRNWRRSPSGL